MSNKCDKKGQRREKGQSILQTLFQHYELRGKKSNKGERVQLVSRTGLEWRTIYKWLFDRERKEGKQESRRGRPMQKIGEGESEEKK